MRPWPAFPPAESGMGGDASAAGDCPRALRVVGRSAALENSDVCGEYVCAGEYMGRMAYQKPGSSMAVRYWPPLRRWVIDREGLREADVCVAYADDTVGSAHPAHAKLIWNVWEANAQSHVQDREVIVVDAPPAVALVGRCAGRENCMVNGEYELVDVRHGRPAYMHRHADSVIRYYAPEDRWLISSAESTGSHCSAFAESMGAPHPGFPELEWQFWETQRGGFLPDPASRTLAAPGLLHIIGRSSQAENARICGTYHLAGMRDGRPVYVQPGTQKVIRYSAKNDWWLIDCDGLAEPSLASRLYQWILSGDPSAAGDRCSAYAEAHGASHPGHSALEWQVWESRGGRHMFDSWVRGTTAPLVVRLCGRDPKAENADIAGDYWLAGTHFGRPAFQKRGERAVIRYHPRARRWLVDREGLRDSDLCVAYADAAADSEHPADADLLWHIFESNRGCHLPDTGVSAIVPSEAPEDLPSFDITAATAAAPAAAPAGVCQPVAASVCADAKRRRLGAQDAAAAAVQAAPPASGGAGWFGLFGG